MASSSSRRVVVTGLGLVSPLGANMEMSWNNLCTGYNPIRRFTPEADGSEWEATESRTGGEIHPSFVSEAWMTLIPDT
jgi:3-oxoacyl-[acyl-carrier-protein] synthase II